MQEKVAAAVSRGRGDKAIASELGKSIWTIRMHIRHIYNKTKKHSRGEFISWYHAEYANN